jgi:glycolate oxidase FAD binding subunit
MVALDPLWPETATVGGIIATNDSGPMRLKYGSLRDLIIGMTIVLADGTIAKSGGKVVKNVAGYDLHKLMTGAFGTLGIITEVTFRLHPIPAHTATFAVAATRAVLLAPLIAAIRDSYLLAQALQLRGDSTGFHLDIQLDAHPDVRQSEILQTLTNAAGLKLDSGSDEVWSAREQFFENKDRIVAKATMMPVDVPHFADLLQSYGGTSVSQAYGIMTASLYSINDIIFSSLREEFEAKGGSLTLLRQYEGLTSTGGKSSTSLPLMREIKHQFDPNRTLNPGRFLGGI